GGKDYYEIDRIAGDAGIEVDPDITTMAVQSRQFLIRAVGYLAGEQGIRQFLDIGTGLPTMQNTHEVPPATNECLGGNQPLPTTHPQSQHSESLLPANTLKQPDACHVEWT
ncbi:SAM-dependent methyltransferase, partial [Nocardia sp. NPDC004168]|uniref:SAM-dependent methyltransferase n=1 Tax=Nocardia sp. NPDC004168 TaxID=3154452 RepID=UPI0033B1F06E